ncbi:peroxiredoxin [Rubidibacter lacunae KORDI 51-2]|uniref:Peroxiredoxin n=1 Tax=Rubidibacter lacunae KORDI 51-2 TaxID=582515 RepID=U5DAQ1_9CHRO|nr:redoxin domain-containing protein [Rubidibacter lacunae]ERN41613.1 peroxiredoxin [Rubidibacter lacunae KORDI 51-2]
MTAKAHKKTITRPIVGKPSPPLEVNALGGGVWKLGEQRPGHYTMVVFYRGSHCPICQQYITDLDRKLDVFVRLGVSAIAISGDTEERAKHFQEKGHLQQVTIGYGLPPEVMCRWGLYLSRRHFEDEPTLFCEPALFLVKPDTCLYFANIGTHPFSRVSFDFLQQGLEYIIPRNYPFRGTE